MKLSYKINLAILVTFLAITVAFILVRQPYQKERIEALTHKVEIFLHTIVDQERSPIANAVFEGRKRALEIRLEKLAGLEDVIDAAVLDPQGELIASSKGYDTSAVPSRIEVKEVRSATKSWRANLLDGGTVNFIQSIDLAGERLGVIHIRYSLEDIAETQRKSSTIFVTLLGTILVVMLVGLNVVLGRAVTSPIARLRDGMRLIERGERGSALEVDSNDEIGELSSAFNRMAHALTESYREIEETNRELKHEVDERTRLATAIEQAAEDIIITDEKSVIQYVNPAFEKVTGYSREESLGRTPSFLRSGEHDKLFYKELWTALKAGKPFRCRFVNLSKDGQKIIQEASTAPFFDESGNISGYVSVRRDVTEQDRLEQQMAQAQKMEAIGTLAGGIAHDFNNILSAVVGFSELSIYEAKGNQKLTDNLNQILSAGNRARELVKQILTFSRQAEIEEKAVEVAEIAEEALKMLRASLPTTIEIKKVLKSKAKVFADPTQIHQIIMNVCTNAGLAMKEQGGVLTVAVEEVEVDSIFAEAHVGLSTGSHLLLTVTDTGCGMPKGVVDRIFDPFFSTRPKGEGTGMGLSVVHGIVTKHSGAVTVYSEPGLGTTFKIYLPAVDEEKKRIVVEDETLPTGTEHILFVDDEQMQVDLAYKMLGVLGYRVTATTDSQEALDLFMSNPEDFDLLITDMTMPKLTGDMLSKEVRQLRPELPIILCTGYSDRLTDEFVESVGISCCMLKPMVLGEFARQIRQALDSGCA